MPWLSKNCENICFKPTMHFKPRKLKLCTFPHTLSLLLVGLLSLNPSMAIPLLPLVWLNQLLCPLGCHLKKNTLFHRTCYLVLLFLLVCALTPSGQYTDDLRQLAVFFVSVSIPRPWIPRGELILSTPRHHHRWHICIPLWSHHLIKD